MEIMRTVHLRWQRWMYRERTLTVKVAGRFTHIFLKDMNRRASWPDSAGVCMVHEMQQFGETRGQKC